MEALVNYWRDRYTAEELVEHLGLSIDDLMDGIDMWLATNANHPVVREDVETIYGYRNS